MLMCLSRSLKRLTAGNLVIVSHRAAAWFLLLYVKDVEQTTLRIFTTPGLTLPRRSHLRQGNSDFRERRTTCT